MVSVRLASAVVAALWLASCSRVEFLVLNPKSATFQRVGDTRAVSVIGKSRQGIEYPKIMVAWETKDPKVVAVDRGILKAVGHGRTMVVVRTAEGVSAELPVEVILVDKVEVKQTELFLSLETGGAKLDVTAYDPDGREVRGRGINTRCVSQSVCSSSQETVFPIDVGKTTVEVSVGAKSTILPVTVVEKAKQIEALKRKDKGK